MAFATFDGRRLHYTDTAAGQEADDRPVLLFVHAYTCNLTLWDGMIARFSPHYRCLAFDLPGHGHSDPNDKASEMAFLAQCAVAVMDAAAIERAHMCGLSIGGMIGQHLGLDHAERMQSLTLACTTGRLSPDMAAVWDERIEQLQTKGLWSQIGGTIERWYGDGVMAGFGPDDLDPIASMIASTTVAGAVSCGLAVKAHDLLDRLCAIKTPTLVLGAQRDLSFPQHHPQALAQAIEASRLVMLADAGHLAPVQVPDAFAEAMSSFHATL